MKAVHGVWLLALLVVGCPQPGTKATLEELGGARLSLTQDLPEGGKLEVLADTVRGEQACPRLEDARARMNGVDLEQEEKGGQVWIVITSGGWCSWPRWAFKLPPQTEEVSEIEVTDQTGQMLFGLASLGAQRTLTYEGPLPGPRPGDPVTLLWSPGTDVLENVRVVVDSTEVEGSLVAARNGRIGFIFPPSIPSGRHRLIVDAWAHPGTAHCEPDPAGCDASFERTELVPDGFAMTIDVP